MRTIVKDHLATSDHILARPRYWGGAFLNSGLHWAAADQFRLEILCEANADIEMSAAALGRKPTILAWRARDNGITLPKQWASLIRPKKTRSPDRVNLQYPYIITPRDEHADLMAVNAIIPRAIPDHMRADICQEIMVAILEGRTDIERLKRQRQSSAYFIRKFYHDNYEQGGHALSFNDMGRDDYDGDAAASLIAARGRKDAVLHAYHPPSQFEAVWEGEVKRAQFGMHELGAFLTEDEVEEFLSSAPHDKGPEN